MKQSLASLHVVVPVMALLLCGLPAGAITFTSDTVVSFNNTNYDGENIIVTNCTLTVDGLHSFASLQVLNGATLTHSFAPNGLLENPLTITDEPLVLSATNAATLSNANVVVSTILVQDLSGLVTYTNGVDYVADTDTYGITTLLLTPNSAIAEDSTNLISYDYLGAPVAGGLRLTVAGDVFVATGGAINTDGRGYAGGFGFGAGQSGGSPSSGSGAGHGGLGGQSAAGGGVGAIYDSIQQPAYLGSGGGRSYGGVGGPGGGSIKLVVGGNLRIEGDMTANGGNGVNERSGGGSGGSIWLTCQSFSGAGVLSANGGDGEPSQGGGGAGGRISLQFSSNTFSGRTLAHGGYGYVAGGAGTVYTRASSESVGQVLVDNGGRSGTTVLPVAGETFDFTLQGATLALPDSQTFRNLLLCSNAWITLSSQLAILTANGNATIQAGSGISADSAGYPGNQGPGAGRFYSYLSIYTGGGGGYGGFGAAGGTTNSYGGTTYGQVTGPVDLGSGGGAYSNLAPGGAGGGAVRFNVGGMLILDGRISADGGAGVGEGSGGGSGGSVWLNVGTLAGAGVVSANGGTGNGFGLTGGGGGGGGRIAIQYGMNLFFGVVCAQGGSGSATGGAGTIFTLPNSQAYGQVLVDNGGQSGTNTSWSSLGPVDLTVKGGGVVSLPNALAVRTLIVASNGWLKMANLAQQSLTVTGNATVQAGGGIIADGAGYAGGLGPGAGRYVSTRSGYTGGGGGYGGYGTAGGAPAGYSAYGGTPYGSVTEPTDAGSGGGSFGSTLQGGAGGGIIGLHVTGLLQVDGIISADGGGGATPGAGGGSGGTVSLTAGTLSGSGVISANGGTGNYLGGGGGGGRIAIVYGAYDFAGIISAYGGGGYGWGGAGTIFTERLEDPGQIVADNGGQSGTNTTLGSTQIANHTVTVRNGAVLSLPGSQTFANLLVASNGWVSIVNQVLTVTGNATIQAGGSIIADGTGYPGGSGPGEGKVSESGYGYIGGGAGHGGYGASGAGGLYSNEGSEGSSGGTTYGSVTAPVEAGSGGGGYNSISAPQAAGGAGGGAIHLNVTGTLQVDGSVSARGLAGAGPSAGGGSGGSIYLSIGTLSGSGLIAADGGAGNSLGGGGGGGCIAIVSTVANTFSGRITAFGGGGYARGGAGTIYLRPNPNAPLQQGGSALLVVDNGGQAGTNTSLPSTETVDVTVAGGAVVSLGSSQTRVGNLLVASNGWLSVVGSPASGATLFATGNATIQAGGGIVADGAGYTGGTGPGAGGYVAGPGGYGSGGGGYGGYGASSGGNPAAHGGAISGAVTAIAAGSGGGGSGSSNPTLTGGAGGGSITLNVAGTLEVDGRISASGGAGVTANAGGGSGGGISLTAKTLVGAGVISADGGPGNGLGGGGGGGRIVINSTASDFSGLMSAYGGGGYARGGAGTIYTKANGQPWGQVVVDNGGQAGTNTSWLSGGTIDLSVLGGAVVSPPIAQPLGSLLVAANSWMIVGAQSLLISSNATIQAGGGILADGTGYPGGQGPGAGRPGQSAFGFSGGGGGHGGYGASGGTPAAYGGGTYGSVLEALASGSGGGNYSSLSPAGAGGGAIQMTVGGTLAVNGRISANGADGVGQGTGGGSGGSVSLAAGMLAGTGTISANGGAGNELGGGGGGGLVSIQYGSNVFEGIMSAYGGSGYAWGGAGVLYVKSKAEVAGQVVVDNGGRNGTNTPLPYLSSFDLIIKGGAVAFPASSFLMVSNLSIGSGAALTCLSSQSNLDVAVVRAATIDAAGLMTVDGKGFGVGTGPGAGLTSSSAVGSGAGYGGSGGASSLLPGGGTYGSELQPIDWGSGGGHGSGVYTRGSEGGGAIRLTVGGTLTLNGRMSADGNAALQDNGGGGSGGSIWLTVGALAGDGVIAAEGGTGELYDGGGGGGGRIAIYTPINAFNGRISAVGGDGASPGQAGSIYYGSSINPPRIVSCTPAGPVNSAVSSIDLVFNTFINPASAWNGNLFLVAPDGAPVSGQVVTPVSPYHVQVRFPQQIAQGDYTVSVGSAIVDLFGQPMAQVYTSAFSIVWSAVEGKVTNTNGLPVPGVVLQPDSGIASTTTDTGGFYRLSLPPSGAFNVKPSAANLVFVPGSRTYVNVTGTVTNENYLGMSPVALALGARVAGNTNVLAWYGVSGATYQLLYSTNLVDWLPYGGVLAGTNGPLQLLVPMSSEPIKFFRVGASY